MNKKIFIFLCFVIPAHHLFSQIPDDTRYPQHHMYSMYKNPWRFIEQVFVIEPEQTISSAGPQAAQIAAAILGFLPGAFWLKKTTDNYPLAEKKLFSTAGILNTVGAISLSAILSYGLYSLTRNYIKRKTNGEIFRDFIITWPNNKKQTPELLLELLNHVHSEYIATASDKYLSEVSTNIINRIKQSVYEYYPEKYKSKLGYQSKIQTWLKVTIVAIGIAIIIKLLTSATKDVLHVAEHLQDPPEPTPPQPTPPDEIERMFDQKLDAKLEESNNLMDENFTRILDSKLSELQRALEPEPIIQEYGIDQTTNDRTDDVHDGTFEEKGESEEEGEGKKRPKRERSNSVNSVDFDNLALGIINKVKN